MTKCERFKFWVRNHQDEIIVGSLTTFVVVLFVAVIKSDMSYREHMNSELNSFIDELNALHQASEVITS